MERILLGALLITLFVSCGKSPEEKANALIEDDIKKVLYHPETYDPAETQVDSAFTPFDDPAFYEKTVQLCKLGMSIDECDRKMKNAKSSMPIVVFTNLSEGESVKLVEGTVKAGELNKIEIVK